MNQIEVVSGGANQVAVVRHDDNAPSKSISASVSAHGACRIGGWSVHRAAAGLDAASDQRQHAQTRFRRKESVACSSVTLSPRKPKPPDSRAATAPVLRRQTRHMLQRGFIARRNSTGAGRSSELNAFSEGRFHRATVPIYARQQRSASISPRLRPSRPIRGQAPSSAMDSKSRAIAITCAGFPSSAAGSAGFSARGS